MQLKTYTTVYTLPNSQVNLKLAKSYQIVIVSIDWERDPLLNLRSFLLFSSNSHLF